jgi:1-acyl-sn-glycerol-3-phosphate acyltransferase
MHLHYRISQTIASLLFRLTFKTRFLDRYQIPTSGGVLVVSNHVSNLDPPLLSIAVAPRELCFLAKKELFRNKLFGALLLSYNSIPVNRGHIDRSLLDHLSGLLNQGQMLMMLPEGTRSKTGELGAAKPGVGMLALRARVPVLPAYIAGTQTPWRAFWRVGAITVRFGEPIGIAQLDQFPISAEGYRQCSAYFMEKIRQLKEGRS